MCDHHNLCDVWIYKLCFEVFVCSAGILGSVRKASLNYAFYDIEHCAVATVVDAHDWAPEDGTQHIDVGLKAGQYNTD
jgi:hypothetical protein